MARKIAIFDAYGTLFDVNAPMRDLARQIGGKFSDDCPIVANLWRQKQLNYSWLRQIGDCYVDFWQITKDALDFALERTGHNDPAIAAELLALYFKLNAYPEVPATLSALQKRGYSCGILSNGSPDMLNSAIAHAGIAPLIDCALSVAQIGIYKPDPRVYQMVLDHYQAERRQVHFISANGWDIAGAGGFGFRTYWINRIGDPIDRMDAKPDHILADLSQLLDML